MKGSVYHSNRCSLCTAGNTRIFTHPGWILSFYLPYLEKKSWLTYYQDREKAIKEWLRAQPLIEEKRYYPPAYYRNSGSKFIFKNYFREHIRPSTLYIWRNHLGELAGMDIRNIDAIVLDRWYHNLSDDLRQTTKNNTYRIVRAVLNQAWKKKDIENQIPPLDMKKARGKTKHWYTREQQLLVIDHMPEKYQSFFLYLAYHGCRSFEAMRLTWAQVDLKNRTVCLDLTKTDKENLMPIYSGYEFPEPKIRSIDGSEKIFPQRTKTTLWRVLQAACKKAGLEPISVHEFSVHSWTSQKEELGFTSDQVAMTLNKTVDVVKKHYSHARMELKRKVVEG